MAEETLDLDPFDMEDVLAAAEQRKLLREDQTEVAQRILRDRRNAYTRFFGGTGEAGDKRLVMEDLRKFCRGGETPWHDDPRIHALLTGRFEVYRRIEDHMTLSFDDLWERYNKT